MDSPNKQRIQAVRALEETFGVTHSQARDALRRAAVAATRAENRRRNEEIKQEQTVARLAEPHVTESRSVRPQFIGPLQQTATATNASGDSGTTFTPGTYISLVGSTLDFAEQPGSGDRQVVYASDGTISLQDYLPFVPPTDDANYSYRVDAGLGEFTPLLNSDYVVIDADNRVGLLPITGGTVRVLTYHEDGIFELQTFQGQITGGTYVNVAEDVVDFKEQPGSGDRVAVYAAGGTISLRPYAAMDPPYPTTTGVWAYEVTSGPEGTWTLPNKTLAIATPEGPKQGDFFVSNWDDYTG